MIEGDLAAWQTQEKNGGRERAREEDEMESGLIGTIFDDDGFVDDAFSSPRPSPLFCCCAPLLVAFRAAALRTCVATGEE